MKHPDTRALYDYWDAIRLSRPAPLRSDLNPREMKTYLSRLFILQRDSDACYSYRLAGTQLCRYFRRELRGENFLAGWRRNEKQAVSALFGSILDDKVAAVLGIKALMNESCACDMEFVLLPVRLDGSSETRILGCVGVGEPPVWLCREEIVRQEVTSLRILWPDEASAQRFTAPARTGTSQDIFCEEQLIGQRRGHLRVIDGGAS